METSDQAKEVAKDLEGKSSGDVTAGSIPAPSTTAEPTAPVDQDKPDKKKKPSVGI